MNKSLKYFGVLASLALIAVSFQNCGEGFKASSLRSLAGSSSSIIIASHEGWAEIQALGGRAPAAQAAGLNTTIASVYLKWKPMSLSSGSIAYYNIYRATVSGAQDFTQPLVANVNIVDNSYKDYAVTAGLTYYYVVRPIANNRLLSTSQIDTELKVIVPPANMVLVHRWMANQEACAKMNKFVDRNNSYRCTYTGLGSTNGFYDMGYSYFVDTVSLGCNYTAGLLCDGAACLGLASPDGAVTAAQDTVFYDRSAATCWINVDGAVDWRESTDSNLIAAQRALLASNKPGLPPLVNTDQFEAWSTCLAISEPGFASSKRLLRRKEHLAAAAWSPNLSDLEISSLEYDPASLVVTKKCNSNSASGLIFDDLAVPTDPETIASTLAAGSKVLRTGSNATANCVSRYGAQDMTGNTWEWNSDQIIAGKGVASSLDLTNKDWVNWDASALTDAAFSVLPSNGGLFLPALGIPWAAATDGAVQNTSFMNIHDDKFYISPASTDFPDFPYGAFAGGDWLHQAEAGRFSLGLNNYANLVYPIISGRCALVPEGTPVVLAAPLTGPELYTQNCAACHGDLANSAKRNRTFLQIRGAMMNVATMNPLFIINGKFKLSASEIQSISEALAD